MTSAIHTKRGLSNLRSGAPSSAPTCWQALSADELLAHCHRGEPRAFDDLVRRCRDSVYGLAYRLAGNHDDACDIAAETFLRMYRAIGTFRQAITLPAWSNRIVANVFYDMRRYEHRRPAVSLDALAEMVGDSVFESRHHQRDAAAPHEMAEQHERRGILDSAIAELPARQRQMVTLFHHEGRTYGEIADIMRIPIGTVKSRLNRARARLRKTLEPERSALMD